MPRRLDKPVLNGVQLTLSNRQNTHGDFVENSKITQDLKDLCRSGINWNELPPNMKEAIDMICRKLGRILSGDPAQQDHWHDISGYSTLVENWLKTGNSCTPS